MALVTSHCTHVLQEAVAGEPQADGMHDLLPTSIQIALD
jgi:hypothetical protein